MQTAAELCEKLRHQGLKVTPQRRAIFEALENNTQHPTAEQVHDMVRARMPDVALGTIYKVMQELVDMGELLELNFHGDRSRFDPNVSDHSHIQCQGCGRLQDVPQLFPSLSVPSELARGFRIDRHEVVFYGLCPECLAGRKPSEG
ncbi:MAG TPA: transcriptional repressor [Candidatus Xenobia bacterium]|jgi:Fe2+ or Zn2+ uptake regulation protein